ncbi:MAG TPA: aldo/keto reductase, partial [Actinomycetes bacterium]|nr:aldo/keto reductase [Actinomycetes bacterium]
AVTGPAATHGRTPAQVVLRWHLQLGAVPLPKAASEERQRENLDVFDFVLSEVEMAAITGLGRPDGRLWGGDPETNEEM